MDLKPQDHAEAVAIFRATLLGPVLHRVLGHGHLVAELRELSTQRFRPPGAASTRTYSVPTLERWLYAYREKGLPGLRPEPRSDRGFAQEIDEELRELLLDIRREHPGASVPLILQTLVNEGRLEQGAVSEPTVRRLYAAHGLARRAAKNPEAGTRTRLRWQAERPGALWHGDVCHLPSCVVGGQTMPIRIHGLLDDASRYVLALEAHRTEKEIDHARACSRTPCAVMASPTPSTLTTDPRIAARSCKSPVLGWASPCCMPAPTTPRPGGRWSASGGRCGKAA